MTAAPGLRVTEALSVPLARLEARDGCVIAGRSGFCDGIGAGGQIAKGLGAAGVGDGEGAQVAGELPVGCRCGAGDNLDDSE